MSTAPIHAEGFVRLVAEAKTRIREVQAHELAGLLKSNPQARVIDVREDNEYAAGHVEGAEHIGRGIIERDIEARHPDKNETLYLYCGGGSRSALAADNLQKLGYRNVINVDGGWRALKDLMSTKP